MLKDYTDNDLKNLIERANAELDRRKNVEKKNIPEFLDDRQILAAFPNIKVFLNKNMESISKNGYPGKDFEHYCFESLLEMFYGADIWKWYNKFCNY